MTGSPGLALWPLPSQTGTQMNGYVLLTAVLRDPAGIRIDALSGSLPR